MHDDRQPISIADMIAQRPHAPDKAWFDQLRARAEERAEELGIDGRGAPQTVAPERDNPLHRAGVPPIFDRARLQDFPAPVTDAAKRFLAGLADPEARTFGLAVFGPPGTGKSHFGCALVREFLDRGRTARFTRARPMQREVFGSYSSERNEAAVMASYTQPDLLVVDDLGHEGKAGDAALSLLLEVLDERHGWKRATIVTTNLTPQQALERYDDALLSRLRGMRPLVLGGPDRRQRS